MQIKTLQDAFAFFSDKQRCIEYVKKMRWPDGVVTCPNCGSTDVTWLPTRTLFQCKGTHKKRQFSVKVGSVLESSPIPLGDWLIVMWMLGNCRNGVSSYEIARTIGITQKSAWFMLHRLREAMQTPIVPLEGVVEADETYVGGKVKNKHHAQRGNFGRGAGKAAVFGMIERGGRVIAGVVPNVRESSIHPAIQSSLEKEATLYTDDYPVYDKLRRMGYRHQTINHTLERFAKGPVHTNTIENFWAMLKRVLKGTYVSVRPKHLNAYVQEQAYRHNHRRYYSEEQRFAGVLEGTTGKRLTYKELTAG